MVGLNCIADEYNQYSTPLKQMSEKLNQQKLPNDVLNGHRSSAKQVSALPNLHRLSENLGVQIQTQKLNQSITEPFEQKNHIQTVKLEPMSDVSFKLEQAKLRMKSKKEEISVDQVDHASKKQPIYYKTPSSFNSGVETFLPPNYRKIKEQTKTPAPPVNSRMQFYNRVKSKQKQMATSNQVVEFKPENHHHDDDDDDELDNDLNPSNFPTGDWLNPVVSLALSRQINKTTEMHRCTANVMIIMVIKFARSMIRWLVELYRKHRLPFQNPFLPDLPEIEPNHWVTFIVRGVYLLLIFNVIHSLYRWFKKQDQCFDLPLTNEQRLMLGLEAANVSNTEDEKADFVTQKRLFLQKHDIASKPKYKPTIFSEKLNFEKFVPLQQSSVDLTYTPAPVPRPLSNMGAKNYNPEDIAKLNEKFKNTFDINFALDD